MKDEAVVVIIGFVAVIIIVVFLVGIWPQLWPALNAGFGGG